MSDGLMVVRAALSFSGGGSFVKGLQGFTVLWPRVAGCGLFGLGAALLRAVDSA